MFLRQMLEQVRKKCPGLLMNIVRFFQQISMLLHVLRESLQKKAGWLEDQKLQEEAFNILLRNSLDTKKTSKQQALKGG